MDATRLRKFTANGKQYQLVDGLSARDRDIRNWSITLLEVEGDGVFTFFQPRTLKSKIKSLPLCVRIYNTPREILESMLRSAISDKEIESVFDLSAAARKPSTAIKRTRTLTSMVAAAKIAKEYVENFDIRIIDNILHLTIKVQEFKSKEADEYIDLVFKKMSGLFKAVVVDLEKVTYVNSTGISVLARTASEFKMRLVNPSDNVKNVMGLMGLLPLMKISGTVDDAMGEILEEIA